MSLKFIKSAVSADDINFQNAVKGSLHQSPRITSPATNELDTPRTPTASITDPVGTDYLMAARSTDLVLTAGQDILFDSVFNHSTMAYAPATGLFDTHNEETYTVHAPLIVTPANADFTIDLVDSANTVIDAVRKCIVGTRTACDIVFVSHSHAGDRQLKLRVTAGTGNITIKTGSSICVDEVGTEKLRTDLESVTLEWYAQGGVTPLATSAAITKTAGEWPASVTATGLLPSLSPVEVLAKGVSTAGFTVSASTRRLYKTKLDKLITLSGLTGTNNLVRVLVGESSGAAVKDFHCNGNSRKFPAAAGDGGDFIFRNSTDTADLVFYVSSVTGVTPNRVATCLVAVDAPSDIIIRGEGGPAQASRATAYVQLNFAGTGGTITTTGTDIVHTFNADGNLVIPNGVYTAQALIIAGGGGGGSAIAGGGGAGGYLLNSAVAVSPQTYPVVIGAGGAGGTAGGNGGNGTNSTFAGLTAIGGGFGASASDNGGNGGSGGGVRNGSATGAPTTGQGFAGGWDNASVNGTSGGGGGAGGAGASASGSVCGAGGVGLESSITGSPVYRGGGGGGGGYQQGPTTAGAGGNGGGGGGGSSASGAGGTNNTGGGGGGGGYSNAGPTNYAGGAGGSGVVIVRYTPYITTAYASNNG